MTEQELSDEQYALDHHTVRTSVADRLRSLMLRNQLQPGERLVQSELAERLGVSRTPVREALQQLATEGLVSLQPYKGAVVARLSLSDLEEMYSVRAALEGYAGYLAAQNITDQELDQLDALLRSMEKALEQRDVSTLMELNFQFNNTIYAASRQPLLHERAAASMRAANRYRRFHFSVEELAEVALAENREMLDALRKRDPEAVEKLTRIQLQRSVSTLREMVESRTE